MDDELTVTRDIDLDLDTDELWALVGDGDAWADWLADASDVEVVPGGGGEVIDDGERRQVRVDEVVDGRRVRYRWWGDAAPDAVSTVELVVVPRDTGSTLRITETRCAATTMCAALDLRWDVRALALWCHRTAPVRA